MPAGSLRRDYPILRRSRFLTGTYDAELDVVTWIDPSGVEMCEETWKDETTRCFGMMIDGRAQPTGIRQKGGDATVLIVLNAHHDTAAFTLPGMRWRLVLALLIETSSEPTDSNPMFETGDVYEMTARSLVLFVLASPAA